MGFGLKQFAGGPPVPRPPLKVAQMAPFQSAIRTLQKKLEKRFGFQPGGILQHRGHLLSKLIQRISVH
jgi:hypothetical protein